MIFRTKIIAVDIWRELRRNFQIVSRVDAQGATQLTLTEDPGLVTRKPYDRMHRIEDILVNELRSRHADDSVLIDIIIVFAEAFTNIYRHGRKPRTIRISLTADRIGFFFKNRGKLSRRELAMTGLERKARILERIARRRSLRHSFGAGIINIMELVDQDSFHLYQDGEFVVLEMEITFGRSQETPQTPSVQ